MAISGCNCPQCKAEREQAPTAADVRAARAEGERAGRAAEREACAKIAEKFSRFPPDGPYVDTGDLIAAAIRARSEGRRTP